jgi:valyl-tRNA synthetase
VERLFQSYQYGEAGRQIYDFFWGDYADWYLEAAKLQIAEGSDRAFYTVDLMVRVLDYILRMLHPFTPFVTEEIYGHLRKAAEAHSPHLKPEDGDWSEALIVGRWPEPLQDEGWEEENIANFTAVQEIVRAIRNLRSEKNVKPDRRIPAILSASYEVAHLLLHEVSLIAALAGLDAKNVSVVANSQGSFPRPEGSVGLVAGAVEIFLPLSGLVDQEEERARLSKALAETEAQISRLEGLLASDFANKAPKPVVQKEQEKLAAYQETREKLMGQLRAL